MDRVVMHIDVNNAFLSWSAVYYLLKGSKIDIRNTYAVIGGDEQKRTGIVLAKSPLAKEKGITTGETLYSARKKCPELKTYPSNYSFYQKMSSKLFTLIKKYTPDIEIASIDECYIEYTGIQKMYNSPLDFAKMLQKEIYETLKFTVNIGIANNKLCAKMASDFSKPNKIHTLYDDEVKTKMWPLQVDDLFGVGKKSAEKLHMLNIHTIKDLAQADPLKLYPYFKNQSTYLINIASGIDNSIVDSSDYEYKGISNEFTLDHDVNDLKELNKYLLVLSEKVSRRIRKEGKKAYVIAVLIKDNTFKRRTHQKKLTNAVCGSKEIYDVAVKILKEMYNDEDIRLIGLRLDNLTTDNFKQISLFQSVNQEIKNEKLDQIVDDLKNKYGSNIIKKASVKDFKEGRE